MLCDFHSDSCRLHLTPLHELCLPVISPSNHIGLIRDMVFVSKCAVRTHSFDVATLPLEGKIDSTMLNHAPTVLRDESSPIRMFLTSTQHLSISYSSFHVVMLLQTTLAVQCRSFTMTFVAAVLNTILDAVIGVVACTSFSWSVALTSVASSLLLTAVGSSSVLLTASSNHPA